jgi:hypothetical protein
MDDMLSRSAIEISSYLITTRQRIRKLFWQHRNWNNYTYAVTALHNLCMGHSTQAERNMGSELAVAVQNNKPFAFDPMAAMARGAMQATPAIETMMLTLMIKGARILNGVHHMRGITQECSPEQYRMICCQTHRIKHQSVKDMIGTMGLNSKSKFKGHP